MGMGGKSMLMWATESYLELYWRSITGQSVSLMQFLLAFCSFLEVRLVRILEIRAWYSRSERGKRNTILLLRQAANTCCLGWIILGRPGRQLRSLSSLTCFWGSNYSSSHLGEFGHVRWNQLQLWVVLWVLIADDWLMLLRFNVSGLTLTPRAVIEWTELFQIYRNLRERSIVPQVQSWTLLAESNVFFGARYSVHLILFLVDCLVINLSWDLIVRFIVLPWYWGHRCLPFSQWPDESPRRGLWKQIQNWGEEN